LESAAHVICYDQTEDGSQATATTTTPVAPPTSPRVTPASPRASAASAAAVTPTSPKSARGESSEVAAQEEDATQVKKAKVTKPKKSVMFAKTVKEEGAPTIKRNLDKSGKNLLAIGDDVLQHTSLKKLTIGSNKIASTIYFL